MQLALSFPLKIRITASAHARAEGAGTRNPVVTEVGEALVREVLRHVRVLHVGVTGSTISAGPNTAVPYIHDACISAGAEYPP